MGLSDLRNESVKCILKNSSGNIDNYRLHGQCESPAFRVFQTSPADFVVSTRIRLSLLAPRYLGEPLGDAKKTSVSHESLDFPSNKHRGWRGRGRQTNTILALVVQSPSSDADKQLTPPPRSGFLPLIHTVNFIPDIETLNVCALDVTGVHHGACREASVIWYEFAFGRRLLFVYGTRRRSCPFKRLGLSKLTVLLSRL